uniref:Uncharacterized protein n=2 Tax=Acidianus brierleyi TaxID=41673 RepID=A0A2U9IHK5_9CREN
MYMDDKIENSIENGFIDGVKTRVKIRLVFSSKKLERENSIVKEHFYHIGVIEEPKELAGKIILRHGAGIYDIRIRDFCHNSHFYHYFAEKIQGVFSKETFYPQKVIIGKSCPLSQITIVEYLRKKA